MYIINFFYYLFMYILEFIECVIIKFNYFGGIIDFLIS